MRKYWGAGKWSRFAAAHRAEQLRNTLIIFGLIMCFARIPAVAQYVGYVPNSTGKSVTIFGIQTTSNASSGPGNSAGVVTTVSGVGQFPVRVSVAPSLTSAYVTSQSDNTLWSIDLSSLNNGMATAQNINTGNALQLLQPNGIAIAITTVNSAGVLAAYVANQGDDSVSVVSIDPNHNPNTLITNFKLLAGAGATATPPEAATGTGSPSLVFVTTNIGSAPPYVPALWMIDTSTNKATQVSIPKVPSGTFGAIAVSQSIVAGNGDNHTFVAVADQANSQVVLADFDTTAGGLLPTIGIAKLTGLPAGAVPASLTIDPTTTSALSVYVADQVNEKLWSVGVDCSNLCQTNTPTVVALNAALKAAPTGVAITLDGLELFVTESSTPGLEGFSCQGSSCSSVTTNATVGNGPASIAIADIAPGPGPVCWFDISPPSQATAAPGCTDLANCSSSEVTTSGFCAVNHNNTLDKLDLTFTNNNTFGCVAFGLDCSVQGNCTATNSPCSNLLMDFIGGMSVFPVAGAFPVVVTGVSGTTTGTVSSTVNVVSDIAITMQPTNQTINAGQMGMLSVAATGTAPLTYQWYYGTSGNTSMPISGATASSYITTPLTTTTNYWVMVKDISGSANSNTATITVITPPMITTQPMSQTITSGGTATLSVMATGTAPLTYQWYLGTSGNTTMLISGATLSNFTTPPLSATMNYWVRVSNTAGHADSNTATITVNQPTAPTITSQPANQTISPGAMATLTVAATGTAPLTYQWYQGTSGNTTNLISGATNTMYTTPSLKVTTSYWVRVTNSAGHADSNTATITVTTKSLPPTIVSQPVSQAINSGTTATLSVNASGTAPLSYQWYSGTSGNTTKPISGATLSSYTTPPLTTTANYWVKVSNSAGSADSNTATITVVVPVPPSITTQPSSQTINGGQTATLTVVASGMAPLSYQWYQGVTGDTTDAIMTATVSSYTTPPLSMTTSYWVKIGNAAGSVNSNTAVITVNSILTASAPTKPSVLQGQSDQYTISLGTNAGSTPLALSCQTPLPSGVFCLFAPTQIAGGQMSMLTISTTGPVAYLPLPGGLRNQYPLFLPVAGIALLGASFTGHGSKRKKRLPWWLAGVAVILTIVLGGCGSNPSSVPPGSPVTPAGTYTVVVLATDAQNNVVGSTPVMLTVH
jgi:hypothetical protein